MFSAVAVPLAGVPLVWVLSVKRSVTQLLKALMSFLRRTLLSLNRKVDGVSGSGSGSEGVELPRWQKEVQK